MRFSILFLLAASLVADGGGVVAQSTVNGLRVTVFATPLPMSTGQEQIAVLVETQRAAEPVSDARVDIRARSPQGGVEDVAATKSQTQDGWYTVRQRLPVAGKWEFEVLVDAAGVSACIPVHASVQNAGRPIGAFIPLIALAPAGAILLAFNRILRGKCVTADLADD